MQKIDVGRKLFMKIEKGSKQFVCYKKGPYIFRCVQEAPDQKSLGNIAQNNFGSQSNKTSNDKTDQKNLPSWSVHSAKTQVLK